MRLIPQINLSGAAAEPLDDHRVRRAPRRSYRSAPFERETDYSYRSEPSKRAFCLIIGRSTSYD